VGESIVGYFLKAYRLPLEGFPVFRADLGPDFLFRLSGLFLFGLLYVLPCGTLPGCCAFGEDLGFILAVFSVLACRLSSEDESAVKA
jgi:hypothetical protein